jgi:hypothetical protein
MQKKSFAVSYTSTSLAQDRRKDNVALSRITFSSPRGSASPEPLPDVIVVVVCVFSNMEMDDSFLSCVAVMLIAEAVKTEEMNKGGD